MEKLQIPTCSAPFQAEKLAVLSPSFAALLHIRGFLVFGKTTFPRMPSERPSALIGCPIAGETLSREVFLVQEATRRDFGYRGGACAAGGNPRQDGDGTAL